MKTAVIITAAGLSSRMHDFKPLLYIGDMPMIDRVIQTYRAAGIEEIIVVTGYKSNILLKHLEKLDVKVCVNAQYATTEMLDSIKLGLDALDKDEEAIFITPVDIPLVKAETINRLTQTDKLVAKPVYNKRSGHPVMLKTPVVTDILNYTGEDGLRGAIKSLGDYVDYVKVDDIGVTLDADTKADLLQLRQAERTSRNADNFWLEVEIKIGNKDVILNAERAQFFEMIEKTESIRNACECMHMSYTKGWNIIRNCEKETGFKLLEKSVGGLNGGHSQLTDKGKALIEAYTQLFEDVKSASLDSFKERFTKFREKEHAN